jgi:hypothetical protein
MTSLVFLQVQVEKYLNFSREKVPIGKLILLSTGSLKEIILKDQKEYSSHFILLVTYEWAQKAVSLSLSCKPFLPSVM